MPDLSLYLQICNLEILIASSASRSGPGWSSLSGSDDCPAYCKSETLQLGVLTWCQCGQFAGHLCVSSVDCRLHHC